MPSIQSGFCIDHDLGEDGKLVTVFSAPDYPQFRDFGDTRHNNEGAFIRLKGDSNFCSVDDVCFFSATPRPPAECYYDLDVGGSDVEGPSDGSCGSGLSSAGEED
jgi:serine/threonine-protein phosphatase 5